MPMSYGDDWISPATPGLPQARCANPACTADGVPSALVVAATLDDSGLCRPCAQTADNYRPTMDLGA